MGRPMSTVSPREIVRLAPGEQGLAQFALQVMSIIAGDGVHADRRPREDVLRLMVRGAMTGDPVVLSSLSVEFRRHRIPAETLVDVYIPAAVDEIGAARHEDVIDILDATLAMARMQNLLRELGRGWTADAGGRGRDSAVLMVAPEGESHTLGAVLAATQLRRSGVSVGMLMSPGWSAIEQQLRLRRFDAVFLSIGNYDSLEKAASIVNSIRGRMKLSVPVLAGGSVPMEMDVVRRATGADFATKDIKAALGFLGLRESLHAAQ